jgi:integrase/recombinase XerD
MARMNRRLDIHGFDRQYVTMEKRVREAPISDRNRELIFGYRDACILHQTCEKVRLMKIMGELLFEAHQLSKDFDQLTRQDIEHYVASLLQRQPPYTWETLTTKKIILKQFMTWVYHPEGFPDFSEPVPQISWLKTHSARKEERKLERGDLLTPQDIEKLLNICHNPRDQALIAILWETGGRISEIGNLQLKHVTKAQHGYTLDVNGKTGRRTPLILTAAPYLGAWLALHPQKENPEAPLWPIYQYKAVSKQICYSTIRNLLQRHFKHAGIQKPYNPHIFRHSRATYTLANGIFTEQQAKSYYGWTPDSEMLSTYSHLVSQDANDALLKANGMTVAQQRQDELKPVECHICNQLNAPKAEYCTKCGAVLDLKKAYEHQKVHDLKEELFVNLFKILVEKGLVDEAAKEVHDADLGMTLKRLAQHINQEKHIAEP